MMCVCDVVMCLWCVVVFVMCVCDGFGGMVVGVCVVEVVCVMYLVCDLVVVKMVMMMCVLMCVYIEMYGC